jgi:ABC-type antimicrobial peptide transport system permease subunit
VIWLDLSTAGVFEVGPLDPATFAATSLTLLAVAVVAAAVPARRSMRMAPVDALRTE